ncbi:hypothetical protein GF373_12500 [bacterium]|nr:hypothetical protein [bacterium]
MLDPSQRKKLLELETQTPTLKDKYQKEIQTMIENPLPTWRKITWVLSGLLGVFFFLFFGYTYLTLPDEFPQLASLGFVLGSVFGLIWAFLAFRIAQKGAFNLRKDAGLSTGAAWMFLVFMITITMMQGMKMDDAAQGGRMIVSGLVFLIMGVVFMLQYRIKESETNLKETILRLELKIAEMDEKRETKQK